MTIDKKSLINWVGGKRLLRKTIEPLIPKDIKSYSRIPQGKRFKDTKSLLFCPY